MILILGTRGMSQQRNSGVSRPKSLVFLRFEGHTDLLGPHPFTWRSGRKSLSSCSFLLPKNKSIAVHELDSSLIVPCSREIPDLLHCHLSWTYPSGPVNRSINPSFINMECTAYQGNFFLDSVAFLPPIYRSLEALRAENREKVSKKSSWAFWPRVSKNSRKGRKVPEMTLFGDFWGTFRPFRDFFETLGRKAQEDFLETFSLFSARRASRLL